jgi:DeoR/GlpR family transcriptional regulator of sugar metabolism
MDPAEAFTKQLVLSRAREVILLADSTKLGTRSFVRAGRLAEIDVLVTDAAIDARIARTLGRRGVRVIAA